MRLNLVHDARQRFRRQFDVSLRLDVSLRRLEEGEIVEHCSPAHRRRAATGLRHATPLRAEVERGASSWLEEATDGRAPSPARQVVAGCFMVALASARAVAGQLRSGGGWLRTLSLSGTRTDIQRWPWQSLQTRSPFFGRGFQYSCGAASINSGVLTSFGQASLRSQSGQPTICSCYRGKR